MSKPATPQVLAAEADVAEMYDRAAKHGRAASEHEATRQQIITDAEADAATYMREASESVEKYMAQARAKVDQDLQQARQRSEAQAASRDIEAERETYWKALAARESVDAGLPAPTLVDLQQVERS